MDNSSVNQSGVNQSDKTDYLAQAALNPAVKMRKRVNQQNEEKRHDQRQLTKTPPAPTVSRQMLPGSQPQARPNLAKIANNPLGVDLLEVGEPTEQAAGSSQPDAEQGRGAAKLLTKLAKQSGVARSALSDMLSHLKTAQNDNDFAFYADIYTNLLQDQRYTKMCASNQRALANQLTKMSASDLATTIHLVGDALPGAKDDEAGFALRSHFRSFWARHNSGKKGVRLKSFPTVLPVLQRDSGEQSASQHQDQSPEKRDTHNIAQMNRYYNDIDQCYDQISKKLDTAKYLDDITEMPDIAKPPQPDLTGLSEKVTLYVLKRYREASIAFSDLQDKRVILTQRLRVQNSLRPLPAMAPTDLDKTLTQTEEIASPLQTTTSELRGTVGIGMTPGRNEVFSQIRDLLEEIRNYIKDSHQMTTLPSKPNHYGISQSRFGIRRYQELSQLSWKELSPAELPIMQNLGFSQAMWDGRRNGISKKPAAFSKSFQSLSSKERQAVAALNIDEHSWQALVDVLYSSSS